MSEEGGSSELEEYGSVEGLLKGKGPRRIQEEPPKEKTGETEKAEKAGSEPSYFDQPTEEEAKAQQLVEELKRRETGIQKAKGIISKITRPSPPPPGVQPQTQGARSPLTEEEVAEQIVKTLESLESVDERRKRIKELLAKRFGVKVEDLYVHRDEVQRLIQEAYEHGRKEGLEEKNRSEDLMDQVTSILESLETADEKRRKLKELLAKRLGIGVEDLYIHKDEAAKLMQEAYQRGKEDQLEDRQIRAVENIVQGAVDRVISEIFGPIIHAWYERGISGGGESVRRAEAESASGEGEVSGEGGGGETSRQESTSTS